MNILKYYIGLASEAAIHFARIPPGIFRFGHNAPIRKQLRRHQGLRRPPPLISRQEKLSNSSRFDKKFLGMG